MQSSLISNTSRKGSFQHETYMFTCVFRLPLGHFPLKVGCHGPQVHVCHVIGSRLLRIHCLLVRSSVKLALANRDIPPLISALSPAGVVTNKTQHSVSMLGTSSAHTTDFSMSGRIQPLHRHNTGRRAGEPTACSQLSQQMCIAHQLCFTTLGLGSLSQVMGDLPIP